MENITFSVPEGVPGITNNSELEEKRFLSVMTTGERLVKNARSSPSAQPRDPASLILLCRIQSGSSTRYKNKTFIKLKPNKSLGRA